MTKKQMISTLKGFTFGTLVGSKGVEALDMAISAHEQQSCEDVVSRQAVNTLVDELARAISDERCFIPQRGRSTATIMQEILDLPPVTPQPKTGRWINQHIIYTNATVDFKVCSECRYEFSYDAETGVSDANYCPNCGAKMVEPQESKKVNCKSTKCENCINHNYCDYEPQESEE